MRYLIVIAFAATLSAQQALAPPPAVAGDQPALTAQAHFDIFAHSLLAWDTPMTPWITILPEQHFTTHTGFRDGWRGYANQYKVDMIETGQSKLLRHFIFPTVFHQDERYQPLGQDAPLTARIKHVAAHLIVTQSDDHTHPVFNMSALPSSLVSASLENLYEPASLRTNSELFGNFMGSVGFRFLGDLIGEFSPDIKNIL